MTIKETPPRQRIAVITHSDLHWRLGETGPIFITRPRNLHAIPKIIELDPFPCYSHDPDLVVEMVQHAESCFPIDNLPNYYVLQFEETDRTNAATSRQRIPSAEEPQSYEPCIMLSGKRTPPHIAMTRYLVAHEYGHCVNFWLECKMGVADESISDLDREYAALRGIEADDCYGALQWHKNIGELIANDFRIIVCGIEKEFWPHPGFEHPKGLPKVKSFWRRMAKTFIG